MAFLGAQSNLGGVALSTAVSKVLPEKDAVQGYAVFKNWQNLITSLVALLGALIRKDQNTSLIFSLRNLQLDHLDHRPPDDSLGL